MTTLKVKSEGHPTVPAEARNSPKAAAIALDSCPSICKTSQKLDLTQQLSSKPALQAQVAASITLQRNAQPADCKEALGARPGQTWLLAFTSCAACVIGPLHARHSGLKIAANALLTVEGRSAQQGPDQVILHDRDTSAA